MHIRESEDPAISWEQNISFNFYSYSLLSIFGSLLLFKSNRNNDVKWKQCLQFNFETLQINSSLEFKADS